MTVNFFFVGAFAFLSFLLIWRCVPMPKWTNQIFVLSIKLSAFRVKENETTKNIELNFCLFYAFTLTSATSKCLYYLFHSPIPSIFHRHLFSFRCSIEIDLFLKRINWYVSVCHLFDFSSCCFSVDDEKSSSWWMHFDIDQLSVGFFPLSSSLSLAVSRSLLMSSLVDFDFL